MRDINKGKETQMVSFSNEKFSPKRFSYMDENINLNIRHINRQKIQTQVIYFEGHLR